MGQNNPTYRELTEINCLLEQVNSRLRERVFTLEAMVEGYLQASPQSVVGSMKAADVQQYLVERHGIRRSLTTVSAWMQGRIRSWQRRTGTRRFTTAGDVDYAVYARLIPPLRGE